MIYVYIILCLFNGKVVSANLTLLSLKSSFPIHCTPISKGSECCFSSSEITHNSLTNLAISPNDLLSLILTCSNDGCLILEQNSSCELDECEITAQLALWGYSAKRLHQTHLLWCHWLNRNKWLKCWVLSFTTGPADLDSLPLMTWIADSLRLMKYCWLY